MLIFGIFACKNNSENTPSKEKSNTENPTAKTTQNTPTESDAQPDFTLKSSSGEVVKLSEELKKQPVVLMFYRGQWCPVCMRYLAAFKESVPQIAAKGAKVIAVTPETNEGIAKTVEKTKIDFTILHDVNENVMSDYKVLFSVTDAYQERIRKGKQIDIAFNNGKTKAINNL